MTRSTQTNAAASAEFCLEQFTDLRDELEIAIEAIAHNSLPKLEQSLWRQEMLCQGLKRALVAMSRSGHSRDEDSSLQHAGNSLRSANLTYKALIAQSQRSTALLQDLCVLYKHVRSADTGSKSTLSCEA